MLRSLTESKVSYTGSGSRISPGRYVFPVVFLFALVISYRVAEVDPTVIWDAEVRSNTYNFVKSMFPPDMSWEFTSFAASAALETIYISVLGMALAIAIGFPLALFAANTLTYAGVLNEMSNKHSRYRWSGYLSYGLSRLLLGVFRAIPELVWALVFIVAVGLGPYAGVLAIGVSYGGTLGKVYSEILESIDPQPLEALQSMGVNKLRIVLFGALPEALPDFIAYTLYRWECAVRAAAILGFVGAGGIGQQVDISIRMFNFNQLITLILTILLMVTAIDQLSIYIRKRIY